MGSDRPLSWGDQIYARQGDEHRVWLARNAVESVGGFASKEDAEAYVLAQEEDRAEVERWARTIDHYLWAAFDLDPRTRHGFLVDRIAESLKNAKRIRAALS